MLEKLLRISTSSACSISSLVSRFHLNAPGIRLWLWPEWRSCCSENHIQEDWTAIPVDRWSTRHLTLLEMRCPTPLPSLTAKDEETDTADEFEDGMSCYISTNLGSSLIIFSSFFYFSVSWSILIESITDRYLWCSIFGILALENIAIMLTTGPRLHIYMYCSEM